MSDAPKVKPAPRLAAIFAAVAVAAPLVVASEGWVQKTAPDPIGIPTACAGVTSGVAAGKTYTDDQCVAMTADALLKHGLEIDRCLTVPLSDQTRGAFLSFAYNVGTSAFCSSSLARKANAGDLPGACAELSRWTIAGGRTLPGLVKRRAAERALCEAGLRGFPLTPPKAAAAAPISAPAAPVVALSLSAKPAVVVPFPAKPAGIIARIRSMFG